MRRVSQTWESFLSFKRTMAGYSSSLPPSEPQKEPKMMTLMSTVKNLENQAFEIRDILLRLSRANITINGGNVNVGQSQKATDATESSLEASLAMRLENIHITQAVLLADLRSEIFHLEEALNLADVPEKSVSVSDRRQYTETGYVR